MDTEFYIHPSATNNNPPVRKKWSTSSISGLESLEEVMETMDQYTKDDLPTLPTSRQALEDKRGRRKSWHPTIGKFEKKRRKSAASTDPASPAGDDIKYHRQKRPSWWTIFVPEHFNTKSNKARRSSTDVGRPAAEEPIRFVRSKSRSVDHGFSSPFDLDSLRSKVEGRFESVDRLSRDGSTTGSNSSLSEKKMQGKLSPPVNTITYTVEPNDTLASVAAHFDITPSELAILNRLPSRTVFPGQVIRVPDKRRRDQDSEDKENKQDNPESDKGDDKEKDDKSEVCDEEMDMLEKLRLTSPKPGHAERVRTPLSPTPDTSHQRFLKINVRHITDGQGVVSGVLLVTSNAVMFDPNVSDPLVIEHGPESYGVIAPMEYVVNVAIYHDIAHMRVGSHDQFRPDWPKPEVYHLKEPFPPATDGEGSSGTLLTINQGDSIDSGDPHHSPSAREDSLLAKDETFPELRSSTEDEEEEDAGSLCSCSVPREGDAFPKAFDRDLVTPTNLSTTTEKQESEAEDPTPKNESVALIRSLEERRKSSLDHHWAVPSKVRSLEEQSASVSDTQVMDNNRRNSEGLLVKLSCHDSGIDIRDPPPVVPQVPRKSTYSDADVLLSDEFVPPVPIQPLRPTGAAVSFSLDQSQERSVSESHDGINLRDKDDHEKETKKNKMLKRLSYPLSWMEGLSGDKEEKDSLPSSAESHPPSSHSASSSVFSKVFSSSPINMVTDFSSGLFTKTPSEEGGRFPFPPSTPEPPPTPASADPSKPQGLASFSPSNITSAITNVGRSSVGTFIRQQHQPHHKDKTGPKLDYRSMVSVEDMPELFVSFDKLIPRPAQSCDDPPLYLRLRMGKPKDKKIPKSTPIMSYGKKKMRPEYWFSVPRERVDDLYRFLMVWVPQLYGDLDETTVADRGYELVDSDTELWETEDATARQDGRRGSDDDDIADLTRESWEVLSMSEELRRALYASSSLDLELCLPDLNGVTEILSEDHRKSLCRHLPARAEGYVWTLVFSTSQHGFSLNSMYRKMTRIESPILMVIQDTDNNVFGALTSCALKMSDHFYGTGESLLFRFAPECQVYNWTGDNLYFIKGNNESLSIGAGDGKFGLWLDGDLYQGRTEPCNTYGNDPLTPSVDFVVKTLECWAFI
ncbi:nuclear receptor coactivator 7-like isoform X2 [Macrosteles quadrilineatus]|uniref:nuclear receptor coactivator 7-like isoform X2 n=1 Tax=Macrosteles quadrilineatus TaxID=74068 RepID=UPI0023E2A23E|nr:nuclear receptor coactivator 7-like isoform X2 [Macrosteles quadrilineatus]